jgi:prepilin-type N-terminal cleavage/methylation domain-containing protein
MLKRRQGFTLIELLIVIVIIGILAAIAIPKFSKTREKAFVKAMTSDLRNLATQQELYYNDPANLYTYATLTALQTAKLFYPTEGVSITVSGQSSTGWSATAGHTSTTITCGMAFGDVVGTAPADSAGKVRCITP